MLAAHLFGHSLNGNMSSKKSNAKLSLNEVIAKACLQDSSIQKYFAFCMELLGQPQVFTGCIVLLTIDNEFMGKSILFVVIGMLFMNAVIAQVTLKGIIADSSDKAPLARAKIDLFSLKDNPSTYNAVTGNNGSFELRGVQPDTFRVLINIPGYPLITKTWIISGSSADLGTIFISKAIITATTDSSMPVATAAKPDTTVKPDSTTVSSRNKTTDSSLAGNSTVKTDTITVNNHGLATISGVLQDKADKTPLAGATVNLSPKRNRSLKLDAITNSKGFFSFSGVPADTFVLSVSYVGYEFVDQQINQSSDSVNNLGIILVPKTTKALEGVTIVAKTPPAQQKADTIIYNASAFKVNPDATTEDLIKKMPGITVDKDGTVTAHGDQVKKVTIDGKDFLGDDATAALRNLPSDVVDKIQVFDKLSDQAAFTGFDDGNSVKSINIVTKSGIKNGQFGRVFAGYGTNGRYSAGGNISTFDKDRRISVVGSFNNINQQNFSSQDLLGVTSGGGGGNFGGGGGARGGGGRGGGAGGRGGAGGGGGTDNFTVGQQSGISATNAIGINYTDKWSPKLDMQASYFFNNSNNNNERELHSQTLIGSKTQYTDQNSLTVSKNYNHRFNMRLEYKLDSFNSLIITPSLNFQNNNTVSSGTSQTYYGAGDTSNTSDSRSAVNRTGYNLRNNILYRHTFAKKGRTLSVNVGTTLNKNDGQSYTVQHLRFFENNIATDSLQNQYTDNPTNGYTLSANIAYTEPVGKKGQLQFNYSPSWTKNKADQQTFLYDSTGKGYSQFSPILSNKFDNTVTTNNGGISYRLGSTRDNQFAVGVNLQNSKLESMRIFPSPTTVNQSFTNVLPNLMWRRKLSQKSSFNIFYRASTNFPSVTQLQDVLNLSNQLRISSGNPDLKQAYTHFVSARYTFTNTQKGQSFFANIFLQTQNDYISSATYVASADSVIQQGVVLKNGSQLTKPVNLNGYKALRTFFTFSQPVSFIKSNVNLSTGFTYSRLPGLINYQETVTNNYVYNAGIVIASNISQYVDFNLSYNANFNNATSSAAGQAIQKYVNQAAGVQFNLLSKKGWFIQNDLTNQIYSGLSTGLNQSFWLWNASFGKKFLKNQAGELKIAAFDLLKQNQSIVRTVVENYIEDSRSNVLQQYFLLTFTYSLKNFGSGKTQPQRGNRGNSPNF
jgi:Outer membrane protein beta-barrel family/CarboxypepD_reg-like domain/Carboxypeptidase regulatory-like domain